MCSAVRRRMLVKGTISSVPDRGGGAEEVDPAGAALAGTVGAVETGAAGATGAPDAGAPPARRPSMKPRTSARVILPPHPVPVISAGSIPLSSSKRRTTGDRIRSPQPPEPSPPEDAAGCGGAVTEAGPGATT